MERFDISKLQEKLASFNKKMLIIGQPKGVGLTTEMLQYFCKNLFFEEDFSVMVLCDSQRSKLDVIEMAKDFLYSAYDYESHFDYSTNTLRVFNNVLAIISYKTNETAIVDNVKRNFKFKIAYIDKDEDSEILNYYLTDYLLLCSERQIIATYDTESSIFYIPDNDQYIEKIVVSSELSKKNILALSRLDTYSFDYEKIIKGYFNENYF